MKTEFDILGIGNAIMDILAPVPDTFLAEHNIARGGMTLINAPSALALSEHLGKAAKTAQVAGGSAGNTMVGIAQMGLRAAYIGKVGRDDVGRDLAQGYRAAGLHFETTPVKSASPSGRCLIAVTPDGERSMSTFLGATTELSPKDIRRDLIARAAVIYLEGYLFDAPDAKAAFVRAAEYAQAAGRKVALTLSDSFCVHTHRESFKHLVEHHVDILFANEEEIIALFETDRLDKALDALTSSKTVACITRSAQGSIIQDAARRYLIPVVSVPKLVDSTGAGDQYAAGVLAGRAMGLGWEDAGYLGSLAAAEVISHFGARPETPIHELAIGGFA